MGTCAARTHGGDLCQLLTSARLDHKQSQVRLDIQAEDRRLAKYMLQLFSPTRRHF